MFVTLLYFFSELKNLPSFLILFVTVRTSDKGLTNDERLTNDKCLTNDDGLTNDEGLTNDKGLTNDEGPTNDEGLTLETSALSTLSTQLIMLNYIIAFLTFR